MEKVQSLAEFLGAEEQSDVTVEVRAQREQTVKQFATELLSSPEYRASLYHRVILGTLPPQIEALLYYYAEGKPTERHEHTGKDGQPIETITEVRRVIVHVNQQQQGETPSYTTH